MTVPNYEYVAVFDGARNDEEIRPAVERVREILLAHQCEITYVETWGRRKLAYVIEKKTEGYYVIFYFRIPGAQSPAKELERNARISDILIRHMLCAVPKLKTEEDAQREEAQRESERKAREETQRILAEREKTRAEARAKAAAAAQSAASSAAPAPAQPAPEAVAVEAPPAVAPPDEAVAPPEPAPPAAAESQAAPAAPAVESVDLPAEEPPKVPEAENP